VNPRRGTAIDSRSPSIVCWYVGDQRSGVMTHHSGTPTVIVTLKVKMLRQAEDQKSLQ
jgi:hypothetical protein